MASAMVEMVSIVDVAAGQAAEPRKADEILGTPRRMETGTLNARTVEFIAKAGKMEELREKIRSGVTEILRQRTGFAGSMVLTSHKEPRLVLVLTFWKTVRDATNNRWEDARAVQQQLRPLIDVRTKVHTYEASLPETIEPGAPMHGVVA